MENYLIILFFNTLSAISLVDFISFERPKIKTTHETYFYPDGIPLDRDIVFLSISFDQEKDIRSFLEKKTFRYQHVGNEGKGKSTIGDYKVMAFPTHMIIDRTGKVVLRSLGEEAIKKIDKYLKKL